MASRQVQIPDLSGVEANWLCLFKEELGNTNFWGVVERWGEKQWIRSTDPEEVPSPKFAKPKTRLAINPHLF